MVSSFEGGTEGTLLAGAWDAVDVGSGAAITYSREPAALRPGQPSEGAIQFSRDAWTTGPPRRVGVYVTEHACWEHLDGSQCPDGLGIPAYEWVNVDIPFRCGDGREIRKAPAGGPFWLDDLLAGGTWKP